jgi:hypothetical protein
MTGAKFNTLTGADWLAAMKRGKEPNAVVERIKAARKRCQVKTHVAPSKDVPLDVLRKDLERGIEYFWKRRGMEVPTVSKL